LRPADRSPEQKLIDIMFEVLSRAREIKGTREEAAEWLAENLRQCGFDTQPIGSSWAILKSSYYEKQGR
jgi:hypothetical protein